MRVTGGVTFGGLDVSAVVDPLAAIDGQHDLDLEAGHTLGGSSWRLAGGVRSTAIAVTGGTTWQEQLLVAATAPLPSPGKHLRATFGVELGMFVVKHGGGLDTEWVSWSSGRVFFESYDLGLFVRFEYARR